jgi:hypothetical protein
VFLHGDCCGRVTDDSQSDKSPPLFSPFWRPDRAATFAVPIKGATKAAAFGIVQCMQVLCTVENITTYMAACNPFDVVARPDVCRTCARQGGFHRHGTYERYVSAYRIKVARFRCRYCGLTVSMLPDFALPYRYQSLQETDAYFRASDAQRCNMANAELLRRYWRRWRQHSLMLQRCVGGGGRLNREPLGYWRQLSRGGGLAQWHVQAIARYGLSLLGRYRCHAVA